MQKVGFHQANLLINKLSNDLQQSFNHRNEQLSAAINNIPSLIESSSQSSDLNDTPPTQAANLVQHDQVQLEILKLLKEIRSDMKSSKSYESDTITPPPNRSNLKGRKTSDTSGKMRSDVLKYCWTHGACDYNRHNCFF